MQALESSSRESPRPWQSPGPQSPPDPRVPSPLDPGVPSPLGPILQAQGPVHKQSKVNYNEVELQFKSISSNFIG